MTTVYKEFIKTCETYSQRPFLHIPHEACSHYADSEINLDYNEAHLTVDALAEKYQVKGYGHGHRIAILLENRQEYFLHWLALNKLGCSVVPINGESQIEESAYLLSHSESLIVVSVAEKLSMLEQVNELLDKPLAIIPCDKLDELPESTVPVDGGQPGVDSECALLYTSGSTGKPKGCILTNDYFTLMGAWYRDTGGFVELVPGQERLITPLPMVHMNAMATSTMGMIMTGGCIIQMDRFHPKTWWQSVRDSRATVLHYLGVMPAILLGMPEGDDNFSDQIKFGFGAGVNPKHHAPFEKRFGFPLVEGWAMTECGAGGVIMATTDPRKVGTCCFGKPSDKVLYRLVDEQKNDVPQGENGELLVRANDPNPFKGFFSGYFKDQAATDEATQGDWLHTGDVVREDADGFLYFVDRRKNVIRRSGENISALEVEAAIAPDERVHTVVVTAVPDEIRGDEVFACIILKPDVNTDEDCARSIIDSCLEKLIYFKVPGYIGFFEELPVTGSQKPRRADVKKLAVERVENGNCFDMRHLKKRKKP